MISTDDFNEICWHDNAIHGLRIVGDEAGCYGKLIFDIDYIAEWFCTPGASNRGFHYRVAASDLTFLEVSDLVVSIDYKAALAALQPMSIHEIHRESVTYPTGCPSFKWKIELSWPPNGLITFCSSGFTQQPRMDPVLTDRQFLRPSERT